MPQCPCCSDSLLHHIRGTESYWFCRSCWQEMPILTQRHTANIPKPILAKLAKKIAPPEHGLGSHGLIQPNSFHARLEEKWDKDVVYQSSTEV
jgi:hypothetical protein